LYVFELRVRALVAAATGAVLAVVLGAEGATEAGDQREVVLVSENLVDMGISAEGLSVISVTYAVAVAVVVVVVDVVDEGTSELRQHQHTEDLVGLDTPWRKSHAPARTAVVRHVLWLYYWLASPPGLQDPSGGFPNLKQCRVQ
jgi:hypothetical protein